MKKIHLLLVAFTLTLSSYAQKNDPVILTIDNETIHASEFEYIYSKNNPNPSYKKDSLDDYMKLFVNYKLKVHAAKELGYDTIPRLQKELLQYRKPLALPYMIDKENNEALIKEAYSRIENEVRASHILVSLSPSALPADTVKAYRRAMDLRKQIIDGKDFVAVAQGKNGSDDPSVKTNGGDLGYFSALQMIYPFENAAFNLSIGDISMPVRTQYGYHVIQCTDKRKSPGMISTSHILLMANEGRTPEQNEAAEKKINEIYDLLIAGEKFEDLARKYSEDQSSKVKGGALPSFGAGTKQRMVPNFEEAAYALKKDKDFSKPFKTNYGYHIVRRNELVPIPSYERMYNDLRLRVERDVRSESTHDAFAEGLKKEYNYYDNASKLLSIIYEQLPDEVFEGKWKGLNSDAHNEEILFEFADQTFTIKQFADYFVNNQQRTSVRSKKDLVLEVFKKYVYLMVLQYEDSQLEKKYPAFKSIMQEYSDGILIFEIMQDQVWKKASQDTVGIKAYYEANKNNFTYPLRYNGALYSCNDLAAAKAVYKLAKKNKLNPEEIKEQMNKESELTVNVATQTFNAETTPAFKVNNEIKEFKKGANKPYLNNGIYYVFNVGEKLEPRLREFSEAKGIVTAAYQNKLEEDWLKELNSKYKVVINEDTLYNLGKN